MRSRLADDGNFFTEYFGTGVAAEGMDDLVRLAVAGVSGADARRYVHQGFTAINDILALHNAGVTPNAVGVHLAAGTASTVTGMVALASGTPRAIEAA